MAVRLEVLQPFLKVATSVAMAARVRGFRRSFSMATARAHLGRDLRPVASVELLLWDWLSMPVAGEALAWERSVSSSMDGIPLQYVPRPMLT